MERELILGREDRAKDVASQECTERVTMGIQAQVAVRAIVID